MNGPEHYLMSEDYINTAASLLATGEENARPTADRLIAMAGVHAQLATAAASVIHDSMWANQWSSVLRSTPTMSEPLTPAPEEEQDDGSRARAEP